MRDFSARHAGCVSRSALALGLSLVMLGLVPSAALAASVRAFPGNVIYSGEGTEANKVAVTHGGGNLVFTESGAGVTVTDGDGPGGCSVAGRWRRAPTLA